MSSLVSVIVLNYNGAELLRDCLPTLEAQSYSPLEILVADNGSTDESESVVEEHDARFLDFGENLGFGRANNRAAEQAEGEYLFIVNNDMRFRERCVEDQVAYLEENPDCFSVSCTQFDWDGEKIVFSGNMIERGGLTGTTFPFINQYGKDVDEVTAIPWTCAGNMMARADMFDELGGFDETFFLNVEDVDLCLRAWMRGWSSIYLPAKNNNYIYHKVSETGLPWREYSTQLNIIRFMLKAMPLGLLIKSLGGKLLQGFGSLLLGRFGTGIDIWKALVANLFRLRSTLRLRDEVMSCSEYPLDEILKRFLEAEYPVSAQEILAT